MSVLRFDSVTKTYAGGRVALSDFSFALGEGEMAFATGHSGAGKSTILKLAHLAERPTHGEVIFAGRNLSRVRGSQVPAHRREVGVVFQDHRLLAESSVAENVGLPLVVRGLGASQVRQRVNEVLQRMGLADRLAALPAELSAGEQQRVGIARAIVAAPRLLLADEPTGNLDPTLAAEIMALLAELPARGTSVLVVSHDLALIKQMRQRVLVLDKGQLVDDICPQDLAQ
ncbi:ABC transporter [Stenotrophomonas ginsengisoli]|uniref:Cell division ATP-binding protein FtsE n=1 Tax=Stenotrophomonas ginsengisoli TaxID=336566 RepID=A0A0R0DJV5_9GAMM|nr:ATP-binding cassette domain-containing protein [Stenotrophomonas ginsengisoli]KRG78398.1 ABC transporter [Stenotrophomonas ginsengisoli]